jgi:hypothetical protein
MYVPVLQVFINQDRAHRCLVPQSRTQSHLHLTEVNSKGGAVGENGLAVAGVVGDGRPPEASL